MPKSMTGYGYVHHEDQRWRIAVEVKAINAKYAEVHLRVPATLSAHELRWRSQALAQLQRGKINLSISCEAQQAGTNDLHIDQARFKARYLALKDLAAEVGASPEGLFHLALQAAQVPASKEEIDDQPSVALLEGVLQRALEQCDESRQVEGRALAQQLTQEVQTIEHHLTQVIQLAPARTSAVRQRLQDLLSAAREHFDAARMEQELLYYCERMDMAEEQVRLGQHLVYFREVLEADTAEGKKLGFIAQEMGREINTMGSKAYDAAIQKAVILMKEALEKIKEQLQNIL